MGVMHVVNMTGISIDTWKDADEYCLYVKGRPSKRWMDYGKGDVAENWDDVDDSWYGYNYVLMKEEDMLCRVLK